MEENGLLPVIDRRSLLASGAALAGSTLVARAAGRRARLVLHADHVLNELPANLNGFSVETAQLSDRAYYEAGNASLVALHRRLSPNGVLRLGGNSSEFCYWKATPDTQQPEIKPAGIGRADNTMPQRFTAITPEAIVNLRGFLDACGWSCIYGLNFGTGTPERDAEEAEFVAKVLGPRLIWFEIGNEPDLYRTPNNLLRPAGWDYADYIKEWTAIAQAVAARVPDARFGGPGATSSPDWIARFAEDAPRRARVAGLSGHYYASGPPQSPQVNIENLLRPAPVVAERMAVVMTAARKAHLPFRITEANSCYRGGKPDMSNALASALWGADYVLKILALGGKGVNFHGGLGKQIAASVGDKLPGVRNAADEEIARLGTFYSPWAGNRAEGFSARPLFYGMMLAEQFAGTSMVATTFDSGAVNAAAYAAKAPDGMRIALINKDAVLDLDADIAPATNARRASVWRLEGPGLDATSGVTLGGAEVEHGTARWSPKKVETVAMQAGRLSIAVPHASAALLFVET